MSTSSIDGACSSMARASDTVRFGRLRKVENSVALEKLNGPKRWMMMIFGPMALIESRSDSSNPRIIAVIPTIEVMPITTPRTVSAERILFDLSVSNAMRTTSWARPLRNAISLASFAPKRLDWIETGGSHCGVQPEEEPHGGGNTDAEHHSPELDGGWHRRGHRDQESDPAAEQRADDAAKDRQHNRFGQYLGHDVRLACAERLAEPDFARALADDPQHDVHDDDATDDERKGDHADEHLENAVCCLAVELEEGLRREDAKVVGLFGFEPPRRPQDD